ncbi:hypothetical protein AC578_367 [Pseudocercospora eumusae]|uniref:Serine-rich protein n=1 Tax=Pseudocercospora eumusae TaxID=321146 RepID=A0A139HU40_9PEZI|nr:hypothetical protein AC578_367 [Pseudocercospora eumusae]
MFLEPDPRRTKLTGHGQSMSGFFSSQRPIESPRERQQRRWQGRKALHERSQSQNNQSYPATASSQPTVRLVKPSLSDPTLPAHVRDDSSASSELDDGKENWNKTVEEEEEDDEAEAAIPRLLPQSGVLKEAKASEPGFSASSRDLSVSEAGLPTNEVRSLDLLPNNSHETVTAPDQTLPEPAWPRRSTSSGYYSQCSTLQASEITLAPRRARSQRTSQATTLRTTPTPASTPYEQENRARAHADQDLPGLRPAHALETLQEASPERLITIRPVPHSDTSSPDEPRPGSQPSSEGTLSRPRTAPATTESPTDSEPSPTSRRSPRRVHSTGSIRTLPSTPNLREVSSSPIVETYDSESVTISGPAQLPSSSPNFFAYSPSVGSVRPRSRVRPLRVETSFDSINSRLQRHSSFTRPEIGRSLTANSSCASLESDDTLPPLQIPKKRLRQKAASASPTPQASSTVRDASTDDTMASEDIDTSPYPRRPFSGHLSTIASESEGRTVSHHFSHWSYGSGVLTGDDLSSAPLSPVNDSWRRRDSAPAESMVSSLGPETQPSPATQRTSVESPGDMTLGIFREESAVPQPLFRPQAGPSTAIQGKKKYDGPLPPIPPIPQNRDDDERADTVSEMTRHSLHQKRSGYSLRSKTSNTPGHSRQLSEISCVDSEARFSTVSNGTSIFPTWAKRFYSGTAHLSSKISLHSNSTDGNAPVRHQRGESSWTEHSITSRLGHSYSNAESVSPVSSHFLPAIFRPRTRKKSSEQSRRNSKLRKSQKSKKSNRSRPSQDTPTDSMGIFPDPSPPNPEGDEIETLPSGQPRWGTLQGEDGPPPGKRPLRKYSKQGQWDNMEFPRPMTKDRLSEFGAHEPHLHPSKRTSQTRLSIWKAPSFAESLDTLVKCRCNRQVLLFVLGFIMPLFWMLGAVLPLPKQPASSGDLEKQIAGSQDDVQAAMMAHEAGDAERRWREERKYLKAKWWRMLNRIMSVVGLLVIGAVIALVVVALT